MWAGILAFLQAIPWLGRIVERFVPSREERRQRNIRLQSKMNAKPSTVGLMGAAHLLVLPSGCKTVPFSIRTLPEGNVRRLVESYPEEAEAARKEAPRFTREALKTISRLEEELATRVH